MSRASLVAALLLSASLAGGCASEVARLPDSAKEALAAQEQHVEVARSNLATARAGLDDAHTFRDVARHEVSAAESRARQAATASDLDRARRDVLAGRAREAYADDVVQLRKTRIDETEAALNLARANAELAKYQQLRDHGLAANADPARLFDDRRRAESDLASARIDVARRADAVAASRQIWSRRHEQASARGGERM